MAAPTKTAAFPTSDSRWQGGAGEGALALVLALGLWMSAAAPARAQQAVPGATPAATPSSAPASPAASTEAAPAAASPAAGAAPDAAATTARRGGEAELKELIPDSAVSDAEGWVRQGAVRPASAPAAVTGNAAPTPAGDDLSPDSPMADIAGFTLPWPSQTLDLPELAALPADPDAAPQLAAAASELKAATEKVIVAPGAKPAAKPASAADQKTELAKRVVLAYATNTGSAFPERAAFEARYRTLSALQTLGGKDQELGQLAVRAVTDRQLLEQLLRIYGYYDGEVMQSLATPTPGDAATSASTGVRFDIQPGDRYKLGSIDLGNLVDTGPAYAALRKSFGLNPGDPANSDDVLAAITRLDLALGDSGYPFAKLGSPSLLVDHAREEADLTVPLATGGAYIFGTINSGRPRLMSSRHLARIARFKPGQTYKRSQVDDLRRAVQATGIVAGLKVTPREETPPKDGQPGVVALDVAMTKAPPRTIAGGIGYDTGEGWLLQTSWENRNLFPPEGALKLRGVAGTNEQLAGVTFTRHNVNGRDRTLSVDLTAINATLTAYAARKVGLTITYQRQATLIFQKPWTWSVGVETELSDEREGVPSGVTTGRIQYQTNAVPLQAAYDGSDNLLDPSRGFRASLRVSPEVSFTQGIVSKYVRIQLDNSAYLPVTKSVVLALRTRLGSIIGANLDEIAPSRRFYAGGGGSIRGYGYELVGPRNTLDEPKGGRSLYEFSLEARVKTGWFGGNFSLAPFLDSGGVDVQSTLGFRDMRYGAGMGFRYATSFGPIRLDIGTPLNPRSGDSRIGVYVSLGQAF